MWGCQDKIRLCFVLPPFMPTGFVCFASDNQLPLLERTLRVEIFQEPSPDWVLPDVFNPKIIEILYGARDPHKTAHLRCPCVFPFASPIRQTKGLASIRVQKG